MSWVTYTGPSVLVASKKCRKCAWNNYRHCGVDFCARGKCVAEEELKEGGRHGDKIGQNGFEQKADSSC